MDIVIVSNAKLSRYLTQQTIYSAFRTRGKERITCIVVETCMDAAPYDKAVTIYWPHEFNYNACLNFGFEHTEDEYVMLCNNDLEFMPGWSGIIEEMRKFRIQSASPFSMRNPHKHKYAMNSGTYHGYAIGHELLGWCICVHRSAMEKIGKLNTAVKFWYSDNIYADQLKHAQIKHYLCTDYVVNHLEYSNTLKKLKPDMIHALTSGQKAIYDAERERLFGSNT